MFSMGPAFFNPAATGGGVDPYFPSVTSLIHFDGVNTSKTYTDQISAVAWSSVLNSYLSATQAKFGPTSMFSNAGYANATGIPNVGTGDFTIECWCYATSTTPRGIFDTIFNQSANGLALGYDGSAKIQIYTAGGVTTSSAGVLTTNTWVHHAVVRSGTTVTVYVGGVAAITLTNATNFNGYSGFTFGAYYSNAFPWVGYLDELRVTKGVARYTANFTPPTSAFPNS